MSNSISMPCAPICLQWHPFPWACCSVAPKQSMNNFPTDAVYELKQMASLFLFFLTSIIFSYIMMNIYSSVAVHKNGEQADLGIVSYVSAVLIGFG